MNNNPILYKVLDRNGVGPYSGWQWPLPMIEADGSITPGDWTPKLTGPLVEYEHGYHAIEHVRNLWQWAKFPRIFAMEAKGRLRRPRGSDKVLARQARLLRPLNWTPESTRNLVADIVARVIDQSYFSDADASLEEWQSAVQQYRKGYRLPLLELKDAVSVGVVRYVARAAANLDQMPWYAVPSYVQSVVRIVAERDVALREYCDERLIHYLFAEPGTTGDTAEAIA